MSSLHLTITSLGSIVVDEPDVLSIRAEDASGNFGVLRGHADFLTTLDTGVVSWRTSAGDTYCAVRGGIFTVEGGCQVTIAAREAIADRNLERLESVALGEFQARDEAERTARTESTRMELRAVREILRYLRPGRQPV